ncbi:Hypothetical predicted protein [Mytilus galloprovincialis]|uniref:Uncharacterized protein n=1 Tax=Mytilus galloprovincialis TaxID=29158 RepID=A0A8B6G1P7_MYTGA|nr:Hypothetical predicted protein [Mytilus galloprovincialis]
MFLLRARSFNWDSKAKRCYESVKQRVLAICKPKLLIEQLYMYTITLETRRRIHKFN